MNTTKGIVFQIIHGSFVDGPGIRTTVFLKGCPLSCAWCCNPEGQSAEVELKYAEELCNGCGGCLNVCKERAITVYDAPDGSRVLIDRDKCTNCLECVGVCYTGALDSFGKIYSVAELFDIINKDVSFYKATGGGVTIGGGEPTLQAEFTLELLRVCKANRIHTALDTCGFTINALGVEALKEADLILLDIKGLDKRTHIASTGVDNEMILGNLALLDRIKKPVIIRLPIIPGINDSDAQLDALAGFLSEFRCIERVDIMGYHEYGVVKYRELGMQYAMSGKPYSAERLEEIKSIFERYLIVTQIGG